MLAISLRGVARLDEPIAIKLHIVLAEQVSQPARQREQWRSGLLAFYICDYSRDGFVILFTKVVYNSCHVNLPCADWTSYPH